MQGKVYLVGAGPGDPGLITVRGLECIRQAESIIYDNLVNDDLLSFAKERVRLFYAGKKGGEHFLK
ncbi:MAG: HemD protein, partial [Deltaproteobacteria bacterium]|nr:HemD protein [Deltaproteobacteria bacterium]